MTLGKEAENKRLSYVVNRIESAITRIQNQRIQLDYALEVLEQIEES